MQLRREALIRNVPGDSCNKVRDAEPALRAEHFELRRRTHPIRRELRYTRVVLKHAGKSLAAAVAALGFKAA